MKTQTSKRHLPPISQSKLVLFTAHPFNQTINNNRSSILSYIIHLTRFRGTPSHPFSKKKYSVYRRRFSSNKIVHNSLLQRSTLTHTYTYTSTYVCSIGCRVLWRPLARVKRYLTSHFLSTFPSEYGLKEIAAATAVVGVAFRSRLFYLSVSIVLHVTIVGYITTLEYRLRLDRNANLSK